MVSEAQGGQGWGRNGVMSQAMGRSSLGGWLRALGTQTSSGLLFMWPLTHPIVKLLFVHALK